MATPFPFQSGNTLLASQLNAITTLPSTTKVASHTLVIADQGTRVIMNVATANTVTVNTSIFGAGDIVEIQNIGAGVCTVTAGTATVVSAGPLAIPQNGGGRLVFSSASAATYFPTAVTQSASGLTFITGTTYSAVTSVSLPANTFTSTFDNYRVLFQFTASTGCNLTMRLRAAGSDITASNYYSSFSNTLSDNILVTNNGSAANTVAVTSNNGTPSEGFINMDVYFPEAAKMTAFNGEGLRSVSGNTNIGVLNGGGQYFATTSADSLSFIASAGTLTGQYKVYAYANS